MIKEFNYYSKWPGDEAHLNICTKLYYKLFYSYMGKLFVWKILPQSPEYLGLQSDEGMNDLPELLTEKNLYETPDSLKARYLQEKFEKLYFNSITANASTSSTLKRSLHLASILWKMASSSFVPAGFWLLTTAASKLLLPLLIQKILVSLEERSDENLIVNSVKYITGFFVLLLLNSIATQRHMFLATQSGIIIRSTYASAIYDWTLRMTKTGHMDISEGMITNLVAVDSQKLLEMAQYGHYFWYCPLMVVSISVLLFHTMGPSALIGGVCVFLTLPIIERMTRKMGHIQKKRMKEADKRVQVIATIVEGIKPAKLNCFETRLYEHVNKVRSKESKLIQKELFVIAGISSSVIIASLLGPGATFSAFVLFQEEELSAAKCFTTLLLFKELLLPLRQCGALIGRAVQGWQACQRLGIFLHRETIPKLQLRCSETTSEDVSVYIKNGFFSIPGSLGHQSEQTNQMNQDYHSMQSSFTLSEIDIKLKKSDFFVATGNVGSGKSSLVNAILGEMRCSNQTIMNIKGKIGLCSQSPFIINDTIRQNILFGTNYYDENRYQKVLKACCLLRDLEQIGPLGDLTSVGEKGSLLSGGQQARISIARCVYSQPEIAIFDDVFSALDAETTNLVYENLFVSKDPFCHDKSIVIFVGNVTPILHRADQIMTLSKGRPIFQGNVDDLSKSKSQIGIGDDYDKEPPTRFILPSSHKLVESKQTTDNFSKKASTEVNAKLEKFDDGSHDDVNDWDTWSQWLQQVGGTNFVSGVILTFFCEQVALLSTRWWLVSWTDPGQKPVEMYGRIYSNENDYLETYVYISLFSFVCIYIRNVWFYHGAAKGAKKAFQIAIDKIAKAPMAYFQAVSMGHILNRFTFDMQVLDTNLPQATIESLSYFISLITGAILMCILLPWTLIVILPVAFIFWRIMLHYRRYAIQMRRMDVSSRSITQTLLSEAYNGVTIIRAFGVTKSFSAAFQSSMDKNSSILMNFSAFQRWVLIRIEFLSALVIIFSVSFIVFGNEHVELNGGTVALLIFYAYLWPSSMCAFVQSFVETESFITSVERFRKFSSIPQESDSESVVHLPPGWPVKGDLSFKNVSLRYKEGGPLSLNNVSFSVNDGQWCAIIGRTGAGKSSLTAALFRLNEIESGQIILGGHDLRDISFSDLRGRENGIYIVCQDPFLLPGSLRDYLDPGKRFSDEQIIDTLLMVRVTDDPKKGKILLKDSIYFGGRNYSQGRKQQFCLARALLVRPKVLVLDEATGSIDTDTDAHIQKMIRVQLRNTTVLTIAHRLDTIMDYDIVLVMNKGRVEEFGEPNMLLKDQNSAFSQLVGSSTNISN